ncbi:hypothetical protein M409DRAFT_28231 [Zasmidium cellare ATCC 36951]|uniref:Uncharacterized protein n=1 Tax=Zasmidium cellare ATCC 36951 TaxID=1080233 RepID=A0A6A6C316_ZASCE|nr:uncharacterized protein M409DRAFT_28231 [Zasmidium cellare ATCC 36951]KAF2161504.1 hypothetical protein M409DRAFT_28231 [Zasmidium cellare ATCC 36951]
MAEYTPWYTDADSELAPTLGVGGYGGQVIITGGTSISPAPTSGLDSPSGADKYVVIAYSSNTDIWYWIDQTGNAWTGSFSVGRSFAGPEVTDVNNLPFPDVTVEANESLGSTVNGCSYTGTSEGPGVMTCPDETIQCVTGALDLASGIYPIVECFS